MQKIVFILAVLFAANCWAVEFGPVSSGDQGQDKKTIGAAVDQANHCNEDSDCGAAEFGCEGQYYNRKEITVSDAIDKYNKNPKYKHKCTTPSLPSKHAMCRDGKCVPAS